VNEAASGASVRPTIPPGFARLRGSRILVALIVLIAASAAPAHINALRGRLVDLVHRSDVVLVGIVTVPASLSSSGKDLRIEIIETIHGKLDEKAITAATQARLIQDERQIIFLKREGTGFRCVQPSATRFPATPEDDTDYRRAVEGIAAALRLPQEEQLHALRAALIPALQAKSMPLRYHAALELTALNHEGHQLTAEEHAAIDKIRNAPDFDPALAPIVDGLLRKAATKP
jgi:hypothetical protein